MIHEIIIGTIIIAAFGAFYALARLANRSNITRFERELDRMDRDNG